MEAHEDAGGAARQTKSGRRLHDRHCAAAAGDDLISGLCDDVLLRILGCVADARDVVRTGALSRRWRGLWTRVPVIYFHSLPGFELARDIEPFIAFVNDVLALRAQSEIGVEHLEISFWMRYTDGEEKLSPRCIQVAEGWVRYAVQHAVRSFHFQLCPVLTLTKPQIDYQQQQEEEGSDEADDDGEEMVMEEEEQNSGDEEESDEDDEEMAVMEDQNLDIEGNSDEDDEEMAVGDQNLDIEGNIKETPVMALENLTSSGKLETLFLALEGARVRLPSAVVFASLANLTLESIEVAPGSGHLGRLLSSGYCPRLQKLRMCKIQLPTAQEELVLEAEALSELWLEQMDGMRSLELRTPNLLDLDIFWCPELEKLNVAAPELEKLSCAFNPLKIVVHGDLRSVRILKIDLSVNRDLDYGETSICLLQRCGLEGHLVVYLLENVPRTEGQKVDLIKDMIPQLPHITSLKVHSICERISFGIGVASLLSRFNNLRYLFLRFCEVGYINMKDESRSNGVSCFVCDHTYHRNSDISLPSLQQAEFRGLAGTDCELQFLKCVLSSAVDLRNVSVDFKENCPLDERRDNFKRMLLGDGAWVACKDAYSQWYKRRPCS